MHIYASVGTELLRILNYWRLNYRGSTVCAFISTIWIKFPDWLKIRSGRGSLIYSA